MLLPMEAAPQGRPPDRGQQQNALPSLPLPWCRPGESIAVFDSRPAREVLLATGTVEEKPEADFLTVRATLVASDKLYVQKREVLQAEGFSDLEEFPIFEDRMPTQLLAYLRLARLQNVAEFAKVRAAGGACVGGSVAMEALPTHTTDHVRI